MVTDAKSWQEWASTRSSLFLSSVANFLSRKWQTSRGPSSSLAVKWQGFKFGCSFLLFTFCFVIQIKKKWNNLLWFLTSFCCFSFWNITMPARLISDWVCVCRLSRGLPDRRICGHFILIFAQKENLKLFICEEKLLSRTIRHRV